LVERSAEARAAETGASVEEILAAWAGGEAAPPADAGDDAVSDETAADAEAAPTEQEEAPAQEEAEPAPPAPVVDTPEPAGERAPAAAPDGPFTPPVLVGSKDRPMIVVAAVLGLFFIVLMVGLVGPSMPVDTPGARSSDMDYSDDALHGQDLYLVTGCAACHTQMVRPVVADVGLGPVTLNDTNQILGTRRFGPDLSDVGSRISPSQIEAIIGGLGDHPSLSLAEEDLSDLVAYLSESATSPPEARGEEQAEEPEEGSEDGDAGDGDAGVEGS
jgi:cytochrome c oxidase cbb3-type subunit 2